MSRTRKLDEVEVRVLGALLEKQQTTPDAYPLTTNAVLAACNQKTNRDPVTELSETEVTDALDRLREDVLVWRSQTSRAERWEQRVDRRWELDPARKAVVTLLLLRGPQTPGELRTRADRMHAFASVEEVEETLRGMAHGLDALVAELPRQAGQRESRWTHRVGTEDVREAAAAGAPAGAVRTSGPEPRPEADRAAPPPASGPRLTAASPAAAAALSGAVDPARLDRLESTVRDLQAAVGTLQQQLRQLRSDLGAD